MPARKIRKRRDEKQRRQQPSGIEGNQPASARNTSTSATTQSKTVTSAVTELTTPTPTPPEGGGGGGAVSDANVPSSATAASADVTAGVTGVSAGSKPSNGLQSAERAAIAKFKLWAPIRWNGGGIGLRRRSGDRSTAKELEARAELESDWLSLPVDDGTIMRRFKEIDDRIASHVLEFYMPDKDVDEGEELLSVSHAKRRSITSYVSSFEYLVSLEEARVYVLRALLSGIILEDFDEGAFFTDRYTDDSCKRGRLTSDRTGAASGTDYQEARNRTVLRLADVAYEQLRPFAAHSGSSELRKRSLESVVRSVAQFAEIVERQPARFDLVWQPKGFERPKKDQKKVPLHKEEMEPVITVARERKRDPKVRGVVFPGLEKTVDLESLLLAKIQVLMY